MKNNKKKPKKQQNKSFDVKVIQDLNDKRIVHVSFKIPKWMVDKCF